MLHCIIADLYDAASCLKIQNYKMDNNIISLNESNVCKLRRYSVPTMEDNIQALVMNSLQAGSSNISVRVDLDKSDLRFQVIDDGVGVSKIF